MIKQKFGLNKTYLEDIVNSTSSFRNINSFNLDDFMDYLLQNRYIEYSNGEYILGANLEEKHGLNIMMNFISNFETMMEYSIIYKNKEIGYLQGWFVQVMLRENHILNFLKELRNDKDKIEKIAEKAFISSEYISKTKFYEDLPRFAQIEVLKHELVDIKNTERLLMDPFESF